MNQSAWSKAHIAAHFLPVQTQFDRQTWLTRILKWLCKKSEVIFVGPSGAIAGSKTPEKLPDLSHPGHRPEVYAAYYFGKRRGLHIVATRTGAARSDQQEQNNRADVFRK